MALNFNDAVIMYHMKLPVLIVINIFRHDGWPEDAMVVCWGEIDTLNNYLFLDTFCDDLHSSTEENSVDTFLTEMKYKDFLSSFT